MTSMRGNPKVTIECSLYMSQAVKKRVELLKRYNCGLKVYSRNSSGFVVRSSKFWFRFVTQEEEAVKIIIKNISHPVHIPDAEDILESRVLKISSRRVIYSSYEVSMTGQYAIDFDVRRFQRFVVSKGRRAVVIDQEFVLPIGRGAFFVTHSGEFRTVGIKNFCALVNTMSSLAGLLRWFSLFHVQNEE